MGGTGSKSGRGRLARVTRPRFNSIAGRQATAPATTPSIPSSTRRPLASVVVAGRRARPGGRLASGRVVANPTAQMLAAHVHRCSLSFVRLHAQPAGVVTFRPRPGFQLQSAFFHLLRGGTSLADALGGGAISSSALAGTMARARRPLAGRSNFHQPGRVELALPVPEAAEVTVR